MRTLKSLFVIATLFLAGQVQADITGMITPPAGSNGNVQINKRGAFGADSTFTYSTTTANLSVSTITAGKVIVTTMTVSTFSISGVHPGILMVVGASSSVVTGSVSLSTQVNSRLPLSMLQSTGSFILSGGTMAYTAAFTSGTVFDTSTRTFQGGEFSGTRNDNSTMTAIGQVINGTKTDNSTTTFTGAMDLKLGNTVTDSSTGALFLHSNAAGFNRLIRFSGGVTYDPLIYVPRGSDNIIIGKTTGAATSTTTIFGADGSVTVPNGLLGVGAASAAQAIEAYQATSGVFNGQLNVYDTTAIAAGIGGQIGFGGKWTGSTYTVFSSIQGTKATAVDGNLDAQLILRTRAAAGGMQNHIVMDGNTGSITQPLQPSFLVTNGTGATDVTGDATVYTVLWPTEIYDQGSNFASNTFTAPITGRYLLSVSISIAGMLVTHTGRAVKIVTSNRNYTNDYNHLLAETDTTMTVTCIADMDAADTATITLDVSGSTKVVDVSASGTLNYFSGSLIN